jgi:hypothetical protein
MNDTKAVLVEQLEKKKKKKKKKKIYAMHGQVI